MNERVKAFLKQKEAETGIAIDTENTASADTENTIPANVRDRLLLRAGLYDKVYSEEKSRTNEYPYYDHTVGKHYKEVPIEVTDDELRAIQKAVDGRITNRSVYMDESTYIPEENGCAVATALQVFAWIIFIGGFFAGIFLAIKTVDVGGYYYSRAETKFMWSVALTYWCTAAVSGTLLLGFAKIIELLDAIKFFVAEKIK